MEWVFSIIREAMRGKFYGRVVLVFEAGNVKVVKREETIAPPK